VSYMPFFIKALSLALENHPLLNVRVDLQGGEKPQLEYRQRHNIGIAMDTPGGLIVPNIKDVASLGLFEIAEELQRLQRDGAAGRLSNADLKDGTITISNIGNLGGTYLNPVIVTSEVAILALGRAKKIPAFDSEDRVVPTTVVHASWAGDHRVVGGMDLAKMADEWKRLIERPELMLARMR